MSDMPTITLKIDQTLLNKMDERASGAGQTRSEWLRRLIEDAVTPKPATEHKRPPNHLPYEPNTYEKAGMVKPPVDRREVTPMFKKGVK